MRHPRLTHQVIVGVEEPIFRALEQMSVAASPPQSKSAICREAIYSMLRQYYPQAFGQKSENKIMPSN